MCCVVCVHVLCAGRAAKEEEEEEELGPADDDESLGAEDDDDDDDDGRGVIGADEEGQDGNIVLATYEKVTRQKNRWKCLLRHGVMSLNGRDILFFKANGEFEF
ncbi:unnamed protein product [Closterium sp. NIES-54]